ncbi:MAG: hypothetical protein WC954_03395 [Sphaerochaeta sp.]
MGEYLRFIIRRERRISLIWLLSITASVLIFTSLYPTLVPTHAETLALATSMQNPAMVAMMGPVYGLAQITPAIIMSQETLIWYLIAVAIMNIFLITRHTRGDEEFGRIELLLAKPISVRIPTLAPLIFAIIINAIIALASALGVLIINIEGTTFLGALSFGLAIGGVGLYFAALTLLFAQIFSTSSGVFSASFITVGLMYMIRALADVEQSPLTLISPFGVALQMEVFYSNRLTLLLFLLLPSLFFIDIALLLNSIRDHGSGLIAQRPGKRRASAFLRSPFGLAWHLSKPSTLAWGGGIFLLGLSYGSVIGDLTSFVENNELMQQIILSSGPNTLLDGYVALIFSIMASVVSVPVILSTLRIYNEEITARAELLFSRPTSRRALYTPFLIIAFGESIMMFILLAIGLALGGGGVLSLGEIIGYGLAYLPAVWLFGAVGVFIVGFIPALRSLIWLFFASTFIITYTDFITPLPSYLTKLNPFVFIPHLPVEEFKILPLLILTISSALLITGGLVRYENRDLSNG